MARQPRRQDPGQHLRDHQHGAFHRHRDAQDRRQRAGRCAAALRRVQARRLGAVGLVRGRRHGQRDRSGQARGDAARSRSRSRACAREAIQPVGIRITSDGKTAFVALGPANRVAVVDAATYEVTEIPAGRPARLADGVHAGREISAHHQRRFERRLGHRRRRAQGDQDRSRSGDCPGALRSSP